MDDCKRLEDPEKVLAIVRAGVRWQLARWRVRQIGHDDEDDLTNMMCMWLYCEEPKVLARFDPSRGTANRYIRVVVARRLTDLMRKQGRRAELDEERALAVTEEPSQENPETMLQFRETSDQLLRNLEQNISPRDQRIFREAFVENKSNPEIAAKLDIPKSKVADRVFALRNHLARWLAELDVLVKGRRMR